MSVNNESSLTMPLQESVRERLTLAALRRGWSPEQEAAWRLKQSFGLEKSGLRNLLESLEMPQAIGLKTSNTSTDVSRIISVCTELDVGGLILGAKDCDLNNGRLVALIVSGPLTIVVDTTWANAARTPRISEVETLFQHLEELDLLKSTQACTVRVPDTAHLSAHEAAQVIVEQGKPGAFHLGMYLRMLAGHDHFDLSRFTLAFLEKQRRSLENPGKSI